MPNGNAPPGLPGGQVLSVIMTAPTDILGLATRQLTEAMNTLNVGAQRFAAAAAQPPALPQLPAGMPFALPQLPGFPGMGGAPAGAPAAAAAPTGGQARPFTSGAVGPVRRSTIQV